MRGRTLFEARELTFRQKNNMISLSLSLLFFSPGSVLGQYYTHLYMDTTAQISFQHHFKWFDDFLRVGIEANEVYLVFFDSLYNSSDGGEAFQGHLHPHPNQYSPQLSNLALSPHDENVVFTSGFEQYQQSGYL